MKFYEVYETFFVMRVLFGFFDSVHGCMTLHNGLNCLKMGQVCKFSANCHVVVVVPSAPDLARH